VRILYLIPVVVIISIIIFGLIELMPGDPILGMINPEKTANMTEDQRLAYIETMDVLLGYNQPLFMRYFTWCRDIFTDNFAYSIFLNKPINVFIGTYIMNSFKVNVVGFVIAFLIAIPIGIKSSVKKKTPYNKAVTLISMISISQPSFFIALLLVFVMVKYFRRVSKPHLLIFSVFVPVPYNLKMSEVVYCYNNGCKM